MSEDLFRCRRRHPDPALRLFCLPWAGSGALGYASWNLPPELAVEVWSAQLPGREDRFEEQPLRRIAPMAAQLRAAAAPLLDRPFALFGHSMGALLAFELARELRRHGDPAPSRMFVSGCPAPGLPRRRPAASTLADPDLLRRLAEMAGPSVSALRDPEVLLWLAPTIRADLEACETHRPAEEPRLTVPLIPLAATDDSEVTVDEVAEWRRHSEHCDPVRVFEGGHLYLLDHREEVLARLAAELALVETG